MTMYSHSRLETFRQCKLRFKYQYIDKIKADKEYIEAFLGSRFHEVMEKLYNEKDIKAPTLEELKDYFNEVWKKNFSDKIIVVKKEKTADEYRLVGLKQIEKYYNRYYPFDNVTVLGVERRLLIDLDKTGKYLVQCYIDRLDETENKEIEIHDYKTSRAELPTQDKLDKDNQLALYEIAVRQAWPDTKKVKLVWHYVTYDKEIRSTRTLEQLEELKKRTINTIDQIESTTDFPANESFLCRWCQYQDICPIFSHKVKIEKLPEDEYAKEEGVILVDRLVELSDIKKELNDQIADIEKEQKILEKAIIKKSEQEKVSCFYGRTCQVKINEDMLVKYPGSSEIKRNAFEQALKNMGLYENLTAISWSKMKTFAKQEKWDKYLPGELEDFLSVDKEKRIKLIK